MGLKPRTGSAAEREILLSYFTKVTPAVRGVLERIREEGRETKKNKTEPAASKAMLVAVDELVDLGVPLIGALRFCMVQPRRPLLGPVMRDKRLSSADRVAILQHFVRAKRDEYPVLDLSRQDLTRVPPEIDRVEVPVTTVTDEDLPYREISLGYNKLGRLNDDDFRRLNHFQGLHFMGTKLEEIPSGVRLLESAIMLNFSWTSIRKLPPQIFELRNLRALKLNWTELEAIPESIRKLDKLAFIELCETPFLSVLYRINDNGGVANTDVEKKAERVRQLLTEMHCRIDE